jgi:hypothetical protein
MWQCIFVYSLSNSAWTAFRWLCTMAEIFHNTLQIMVKVKGFADSVIYCLYIIAHYVHNVSDVGSASLVHWSHGSTASFCNQWARNSSRACHFFIHSTYNHATSRTDMMSSYATINLKRSSLTLLLPWELLLLFLSHVICNCLHSWCNLCWRLSYKITETLLK